MPNTLSFQFVIIDSDRQNAVIPCIDGTPLTDLVSDFENSKGYDAAGGYSGFVPVCSLVAYFCGQSGTHAHSDKEGEIYVLACECGEAGCWPLMTTVTPIEGGYRWTDFNQPHRPGRSYDGFGPFVFEKSQYKTAVRDAALKLEATP